MTATLFRRILIGAVLLLTTLSFGPAAVSVLRTNFLVVSLSQCIMAPNIAAACQTATKQLVEQQPLSKVDRHSSVNGRAYAALGYYAQAAQEWPTTDRAIDNPIDAYWLGIAYEHLGQVESTTVLWQSANLPSQVPLLFIQSANTTNDPAQLQRWVRLAQQLTPLRNSDLRAYPDIDEYSSNLVDWGYPLLASDLQQLIADHESSDKIYHWYALATTASLRGDWSTAIQTLLMARTMWPEDELLRVRLIQDYLAADQPSAAQQIAMQWLIGQPANSVALFWGAQSAVRARDFISARQWCERLIALGVNNDQSNQCQRWLKARP